MTSNYWASTQCNDWLISRTQVALAGAEDLEYAVSADELFALRIWMTNCISILTKKLALRQRVTATAIVFFHRFYSCSPGNSFCLTDPALVATACVYVAAKVEEAPLHIRNVAQEAAKHWTELGHPNMSSEISVLAEMEFYLLEDLQFHLVVYHPYRSLVIIAGAAGMGTLQRASGKASMATTWSKMLGALPTSNEDEVKKDKGEESSASPLPGNTGVLDNSPSTTVDTELFFGTPGDGLSGKYEDVMSQKEKGSSLSKEQEEQKKAFIEAIEARQRQLLFDGDDGMPLAQLDELDEQVLQMAWFVLNDSYRTNLLLLFPPHLVAVSAIFLALVLHDSSREKMLKSKKWMEDRRAQHARNTNDPPVDIKNDAELNIKDTKTVLTPPSTTSTSLPKYKFPLPPSPVATTAAMNGNSTSINNSNTIKPPLRGLASLPPRPSHLPPKPGGATNSNPVSSVNTPKIHDSTQKSSPDPSNLKATEEKKDIYKSKVTPVTMPVPPPDAMTFLAALNVDFNLVGEIVQELISLYQFWSREGHDDGVGGILDLNDSRDMFNRLNRMRETRRLDILQNGPGW